MVTMRTGPRRALIIVDVQNDFCEGGSLAVVGGADVAARITAHVATFGADYAEIVASRDWHEDPGAHFADGEPDFVDTWPVHCVAGTDGAAFHPALEVTVDAIVSKGHRDAAYSAFEGIDEGTGMVLGDWLRARAVTALDVVGIATSHCVKATAIDGVGEGFAVRVLRDLAVGVVPDAEVAALDAMRAAGVDVVGVGSGVGDGG